MSVDRCVRLKASSFLAAVIKALKTLLPSGAVLCMFASCDPLSMLHTVRCQTNHRFKCKTQTFKRESYIKRTRLSLENIKKTLSTWQLAAFEGYGLTYVLEPLHFASELIDFEGFYIRDTHVPMMLLWFLWQALVYRESLNNPATRRRPTLGGVFPFMSQSQQRQPTLYDGQYLPWWWRVILAVGSHTGRLVLR